MTTMLNMIIRNHFHPTWKKMDKQEGISARKRIPHNDAILPFSIFLVGSFLSFSKFIFIIINWSRFDDNVVEGFC